LKNCGQTDKTDTSTDNKGRELITNRDSW